jgi:hypothetical protein
MLHPQYIEHQLILLHFTNNYILFWESHVIRHLRFVVNYLPVVESPYLIMVFVNFNPCVFGFLLPISRRQCISN